MSAPTILQGLVNALALLNRMVVGTPEAAHERDQAIHVVRRLIEHRVSGSAPEKLPEQEKPPGNDPKADLISALESDSDRLGGKAELAKKLGVSTSFLYSMLNGYRGVPEHIANRYGFTQVKTYARLGPVKKSGAA